MKGRLEMVDTWRSGAADRPDRPYHVKRTIGDDHPYHVKRTIEDDHPYL